MVSSNILTIRGVPSEAERYCWTVYQVFLLFSSIIGDSIILIASIKYDTINVNRFIVALIQHIAVADIITSIFYILPGTVSQIANNYKWLLGDFCQISVPISWLSYRAAAYLLCVMIISKVFILRYPLRSITLSKSRAHKVAAVIWTWNLVYPAYNLIARNHPYFDYRFNNCIYSEEAPGWKWIKVAAGSLLNITIIMSTAILLIMAKRKTRRRNDLRWQGVLTVVLTSSVHCLSTLPYAVYLVAIYLVTEKYLGYIDPVYYRVCMNISYLNILWNFYVYIFTISSFREFVRSKIRLLLRFMPVLYGQNEGQNAMVTSRRI